MKKFDFPKSVFIIGEAGVNHNGDKKLAKELIALASECKVDAVKFQTFKPGELTGKFALKTNYMKNNLSDKCNRYDLTKRLALTYDEFLEIKDYADQKEIMFLSTPDGFESLDFVSDYMNINIIKIGSTELNHLDFIKAVSKKNKPIILSTGMGTLGEIERALEIIRKYNQEETIVLHCNSEYPVPLDEVNLKAMVTIRNAFKVDVGFSDHTEGTIASICAVALGARVIEKHFTIDTSLPGPDHKSSLDPSELKMLVSSIRTAESLLGDGIKRPSASEKKNLCSIRRGIVAVRKIKKGEKIRKNMLKAKRPFVDIEPQQLEILIGMTLNRDLMEDEPVMWKDVK